MAENGVDIAQAYVHLLPSMEGSEKSITEELVGAGDAAGDKAGKRSGKRFAGSAKKYLAGGAAVAGITAAFSGLYKVGDTFDDLTNTIRVGSGASGDALDGLVSNAENIASSVPADFDTVANTVADVSTRLGLTGDTMETVATQYVEAGRLLGESVDVGKTTAAFNAFKIEGEDVTGAMDQLFQVSQATGIGMNDLASQVAENAPAVQALGFGFDEAASMVGTFDKAGLNSSRMMSGLSRGLVNLAKDGEEPAEAFDRVVDQLGGFIEKGDKAAALDLASEVFGTRNASQFVGALESGTLNLDDMTKAAGQTGDTILGLGEDTRTFGDSWQIFTNQAMLAVEPLASAIFDGLGGAMEAILPIAQSLGSWLADNQWALAAAAGVIGVTLVAAFVAWTASIWAATVALLANPITWIVLAIVALVAALVYVATQTTFFQDIWGAVWGFITDTISIAGDIIGATLSGIADVWSAIWNGIKAVASAVWGAITSVISGAINGVRSVVMSVVGAIASGWSATWNGIKAVASAVWSGIVSFITAYINTVRSVIVAVVHGISSAWSATWNGIKAVASAVWSGITSVISGAINGVRSVITSILSSISGAWSRAWNGLKSLVSNVWGGIVSMFQGAVSTFSGIFGSIASAISGPFRSAFNGIASFWNSTVGALSFNVPDWVPGVGGKGWSVPNIPMLAEGGVVEDPTLAMIGEGSESEAVLPLSKLDRMLQTAAAGGDGGGGMTVRGPLVQVGEVRVDSDARVKQLSQDLWERANRSDRAGGRVNLGGVTA